MQQTPYADLHIHTTYSDGSATPEQVVQEAVSHGIFCIGITDHDAVGGIRPCLKAAQGHDIEVVAGVELSTEIYQKDVHMLGYFIDYESKALNERLKAFQDTRIGRIERMIEKLRKQGIRDITLEEVCELAQSDAIGRPHLAARLVEKGWVADVKEAFDKFLAEGRPAYEPKFKQTPFEAIQLIRNAGGVAVLAHPMITAIDELIPELVQAGLGGLEAYYPGCADNIGRYYEGLARKHGLAVTGGSDFHGESKKFNFVGCVKIPYEWVEELKKKK